MIVQTFRKKPVEIQAIQLEGTIDSTNHVLAWIGAHGADASRADRSNPEAGLLIKTLAGEMLASPGDYVIRGVQGEFYPCKPDIFAATYDAAGEERASVPIKLKMADPNEVSTLIEAAAREEQRIGGTLSQILRAIHRALSNAGCLIVQVDTPRTSDQTTPPPSS